MVTFSDAKIIAKTLVYNRKTIDSLSIENKIIPFQDSIIVVLDKQVKIETRKNTVLHRLLYSSVGINIILILILL